MCYPRNEVIAWYERKTEVILRKYGPGPRVHYHIGLVEPDLEPATDIEGLRRQLVQSQENLLHNAAEFWEAERHLRGVVLDVGCGLGGSSIFFSQNYGAQVFALTNVPGHLQLVTQFATQADVADKVVPILGDACAIPGDRVFDAALAVESSIYLDREAWFHYLAHKVRPDGRVFISDCFAENDEVRKPFDSYWLTCIGTLDEYFRSASAAGFKTEDSLDLTTLTTRFWELSVLYSRHLIESYTASEQEMQSLQRSIKWHTLFQQMWNSRQIRYILLRLVHD